MNWYKVNDKLKYCIARADNQESLVFNLNNKYDDELDKIFKSNNIKVRRVNSSNYAHDVMNRKSTSTHNWNDEDSNSYLYKIEGDNEKKELEKFLEILIEYQGYINNKFLCQNQK